MSDQRAPDETRWTTIRDASSGAQPSDIAFLGMALHRHGRVDEARAALARLRATMEIAPHKDDRESQSFLAEAVELIEGAVPATRTK